MHARPAGRRVRCARRARLAFLCRLLGAAAVPAIPAPAAHAQAQAQAQAANPHPHHPAERHAPAHRPAHPVHARPHEPIRHPAPVPAHRRAPERHPVRAAAPHPAAVAPVPVAPPPPPPPKPVGAVTGLPLPRFAALRSDDVNLRSGPGTRYPILWVYKRRDLPVQVDREFDVWRLIEDRDGTRGWVNQATLIGTRSFVAVPPAPPPAASTAPGTGTGTGTGDAVPVTDATAAIRARPAADAPAVAYLRPGVIGRLLSCRAADAWCHVSVRGVTGWLDRQAVYGLEPGEDFAPPA